MSPSSSDFSAKLIYYLAEPACRSLALAALAGAALAIARAKDATMRLAVWTAVLYASPPESGLKRDVHSEPAEFRAVRVADFRFCLLQFGQRAFRVLLQLRGDPCGPVFSAGFAAKQFAGEFVAA